VDARTTAGLHPIKPRTFAGAPDWSPALLLLLLLLHGLQVSEGDGGDRGLLRALDEHAPVFRDGHFSVESRGFVTGVNLHSHIELAFGAAAEDSVSGRHVCIVAADGCADVAVVSDEVVGRVKADPAEMGQENLNPGVRGIGSGAVVVFAAAEKIAGDVAGGDAHLAKQRDHGVREVLANALAADDGFVDG